MADNESGKSTVNEVRTNSGMFIKKGKQANSQLSVPLKKREEETILNVSTRMEVGRLQGELRDLTSKLLEEGVLDKQFLEIQLLRDESNPDFPAELTSIFFEDAQNLIDRLSMALQQSQQYMDFNKISNDAHQLKGSSSSVGAKRIADVCVSFRGCCDQSNLEGCCRCLQLLKYEFSLTKEKLEYIFKLEKQILAAGGSLPGL